MTIKNGESLRASRPYDLIVWGATGFTGQLVAEYLARHYGAGRDLRWAIGGRSKAKLDDVRAHLASIDPAAKDLAIVVGDARDAASLAPIVKSARVVVSTVGPYAVHGKEMVAACVEHGTDYCDLTGETHFVRAMIDLHHARAKETGARIVHCCGFDSIPSDLGVLMLQAHMRERHASRCSEIKFLMGPQKGGVSGGTIASALNIVEESAHDKGLRRVLADPYALDPDRGDVGPDRGDQRGVRWDADAGAWTAPFVMAAINTRIVRRSNALLGYAYGKDFRYSESTRLGKGAKGWLTAAAFTGALGAFMASVSFSPTRKLLQKTVLPAPGQGPSKAARDAGFFKVDLVGLGEARDGKKVRLFGRVEGTSDPGYGETAKMLSEAAVCLAKDSLDAKGGVITPASCFGMRLVERLRLAGMTFDVSEHDAPRTSSRGDARAHAP